MDTFEHKHNQCHPAAEKAIDRVNDGSRRKMLLIQTRYG
jgi:hypothetical protein